MGMRTLNSWQLCSLDTRQSCNKSGNPNTDRQERWHLPLNGDHLADLNAHEKYGMILAETFAVQTTFGVAALPDPLRLISDGLTCGHGGACSLSRT